MQALADRLKSYKVEGLTTRPVASGKLVRVVGLTLEQPAVAHQLAVYA